ncbi:MAG: cytochrome c biogenesis protein ResB [Acidobacteria bacterium]|nr:cytochrome c biogenesis protein ResB [Acidobacteriota bacterium]
MTEVVNDVDKIAKSVTPLPFTVECTDIQQKLIKKEGPITADNTLDWLTRVKIKDSAYGEQEALIHLNAPYDYHGYRLFQASFIADGKARSITLRVTPESGGAPQDVNIPRAGSATLPDGTRIDFMDFNAQFSLGSEQVETERSVYTNPAATLLIHPPGGEAVKAFAFSPDMAERAPIAKKPVAGYTWRLVDYEKVPLAHVLSIQKDPGSPVVYVGFLMLAMTLGAVFFFSHQRVWALVEERGPQNFEVVLGGNTNRNKLGFGDRFKRLTGAISGEVLEVKKS